MKKLRNTKSDVAAKLERLRVQWLWQAPFIFPLLIINAAISSISAFMMIRAVSEVHCVAMSAALPCMPTPYQTGEQLLDIIAMRDCLWGAVAYDLVAVVILISMALSRHTILFLLSHIEQAAPPNSGSIPKVTVHGFSGGAGMVSESEPG